MFGVYYVRNKLDLDLHALPTKVGRFKIHYLILEDAMEQFLTVNKMT